ncbi:organic cation transporter protein-like [Anneissia japonica]|uniref:organic cation transporter protein-like n=1 Tax=Anneissia japonica TaxID=1529436 RepID=UPI0014257DD4|nr:organic cation transporter protein-like [Anneissia japonica]
MESERDIHFDDIFKHIGQCNQYFFFSYIIVSLCVMSNAWNSLAVVFLFPETDFWCQVDQLDERCLDLNLTEVECILLKNDYRPTDQSSTTLNEGHCNQYNFTDYNFSINASLRNVSIHSCNSGYEYDTTQYKTSVTQEFDLVCEDAYLVPLVISLDYIGALVGSLIFGNFSDSMWTTPFLTKVYALYRLDRQNNTRGGGLMFLVTEKYRSRRLFEYDIPGNELLWIELKASNTKTCIIGLYYRPPNSKCCELVGPSRRSLAGTFISVQWSIGYMVASLYAYLIRNWRFLILAMAITDIIIWIMIFFFVPESPRWLHSVNEVDNAEKILKKACKFSEDPQANFDVCKQFCRQNGEDPTPENIKTQQWSSTFKFVNILRLKNIRKRFLMIAFIWFVSTLVYFGISLSVVNLGANEYAANALAGFVEIPAVFLAWISIERWGRRIILSATMILAGVACATTSFISNHMWVATLGMVGKFWITASYTLIYIVAAEIYPTPIRNTAIGVSSMIGSIGAIIAPQILFAGVIFEQLPYLIFGGLAIAAGLVMLLLPETRGLNLPQTLKEGENLGMNISRQTDETYQDEIE